MFYETALTFHSPFCAFSAYPAADNRDAWNALDEEWKRETVLLGEKYLHFNYPYLSAVDFLDFTRTGNRVRFEEKYFSKRIALDALVLAECVEDCGRFLDDIINGIFSICEESAWQLPPHNTYIRDAKQLPLPDSTAPVLDLFACESGAVLAAVYYLLKSRLDKISPFIAKRIRQELQCRIFWPYLNSHFWWMGNGKEPLNNWTVWCTQNILLCVFLIDSEESLKRRILQKACGSVDFFLEEYGQDGCCDEGAQYYRHAGLCLFNTLEILNAVTNDHFLALYREEKIKNIASYILNVHIDDKYYVNFADCSPVAGRAGVREFLFAKRTGNQNMASFAAMDFREGKADMLLLPGEHNLYYRLQNAFSIREIKEFVPDTVFYSDIYYPSAGVFVARDGTFVLAVKAGDNADSHNHNDCGSFTIYKNGLPFFLDVGVESYSRKTFSPQRYEIWTMQSAYHNLPTIGGFMQKDGKQYKAADVSYQFSDTAASIRMNIAGAYPRETDLLCYDRAVSLVKNKEIVINDRIMFRPNAALPEERKEVLLSFMTYEKPVLREAESTDCLLFSVGSLGKLAIAGAEPETIETIPITDARLKTAWEHEIYRILVRAKGGEVTIHIF